MQAAAAEITQWLERWSAGEAEALEQVSELLYGELRVMAAAFLRRERPEHTLQPTALIHELYLRLLKIPSLKFENRQRFLGLAARIMRQILADHARRLSRAKRGSKPRRVALHDTFASPEANPDDYLILDEALTRLEAVSPLHAQVIELRYFSGLTTVEVAEVLSLSKSTVNRVQRLAEAWLQGVLSGELEPAP